MKTRRALSFLFGGIVATTLVRGGSGCSSEDGATSGLLGDRHRHATDSR